MQNPESLSLKEGLALTLGWQGSYCILQYKYSMYYY